MHVVGVDDALQVLNLKKRVTNSIRDLTLSTLSLLTVPHLEQDMAETQEVTEV